MFGEDLLTQGPTKREVHIYRILEVRHFLMTRYGLPSKWDQVGGVIVLLIDLYTQEIALLATRYMSPERKATSRDTLFFLDRKSVV